MIPRRILAPLVVATAAVLGVIVPASMASAAVATSAGVTTLPPQPFAGNPATADWIGDYLVDGVPSWMTEFGFTAPDEAEPMQPGGALVTKWGTAIDPETLSEMSYLLFVHGSTPTSVQAAALAHIVHTWTAAPQNPGQLDPANDFRHIAYDTAFHLAKLPSGAQDDVTSLLAEAAMLHGPWSITLTAPAAARIGAASNWTVRVLAGVNGVPSRTVSLTVTNGTFAGGATTTTVTTGADGSAAPVAVTPTGAAPAIIATASGPAAAPLVMDPVDADVSRVIQAASAPISASLTGAVATTTIAPELARTGTAVPIVVPALGGALVLLGVLLAIVSAGRARRGRTSR
ncbi:hypothetical protein GCM10009840_19900 [Pseudolysinimonas kribbensis]|uniref:Uncharacterized protein n=1 Tax=Pseudolysinimonas kribbensis TaxID=433641 RepID=A0ABQ6K3D6_9MICO|nr:hypothetical protein [Pseudolysinimonas kribbensis]GMA93595.1 hypothetical protein GCM10025881_04190 [Pseudolysinimonas kribbensis]